MSAEAGSGKISSFPVIDRVEDGHRDRFWGCLRYVGSPCHIGIHRAGQDRVTLTPCRATRARSDWVKENAAAFETE